MKSTVCLAIMLISITSAVYAKDILLSSRPATTSNNVKKALMYDYGKSDDNIVQLSDEVVDRISHLANIKESHFVVLLQGSGTYGMEATLGTIVKPEQKVLILSNGLHGQRIKEIADYLKLPYDLIEVGDGKNFSLKDIDEKLRLEPDIEFVTVVHCETSTGMLNDIQSISDIVANYNKKLIIDAVSSFGAIDINPHKVKYHALVTTTGNSLQSIPGVAIAVIEKSTLINSQGNSRSLSLDLFAQWKQFEENSQWRYTPPVQAISALNQALKELENEGGVVSRYKRYKNNCKILKNGIQKLGFNTIVDELSQSPIMLAFDASHYPKYNFKVLFDEMSARGYILSEGKIADMETFRVGCIGDLHASDAYLTLAAFKKSVSEMKKKDFKG